MFKLFERYKVLVLFVSVTAFGWLIHLFSSTNGTWLKLWGALDVSFAVSMGLIAFMAYLEFIKAEDEIKIYFDIEGKKRDTGLSLLRKDCTRGEILGILGMMQRTTKERFSFDTKELPLLLKQVQEVQKGNKNIFVIEMTLSEFNQFIIEELDDDN